MSKLWLGTGFDELDALIEEKFSNQFDEIKRIGYATGFMNLPVKEGDVVLLSEALPTENEKMEPSEMVLIRVANWLRRHEVRVCLFGSSRKMYGTDSFVKELITRGIYDLLFSDSLQVEDVFNLIQTPASYSQVAHFLDGDQFTPATIDTKKKDVQVDLDPHPEKGSYKKFSLPSFTFPSLSQGGKSETMQTEEVDDKPLPLSIAVSGAPGSGSSFVALNLAVSLSNSGKRVALLETALRPVYTTWLDGISAEDSIVRLEDGDASRYLRINDNLRVFAMDPFQVDAAVNTEKVIASANKLLNVDVIVADMPLEDFVNLKTPVSVLVVNSDLFRCKWVEGVQSSLVVLNMASKRLPIDFEEYKSFWPDTELFTYPYTEDQGVSIVTSIPLVEKSALDRERFEQMMQLLLSTIEQNVQFVSP